MADARLMRPAMLCGISLVLAVSAQNGNAPPGMGEILTCRPMSIPDNIKTKMVQLPNTMPLVFSRTGWLGSDLINEVLSRLVVSHQRCPCPWVATNNDPAILAGAAPDVSEDNKTFFAPMVALKYGGMFPQKAVLDANVAKLNADIQGLTKQQSSLTKQQSSSNALIDDLTEQKASAPCNNVCTTFTKQIAKAQAGLKTVSGLLQKVTVGKNNAEAGLEGLNDKIKKIENVILAYNAADQAGALRCNLMTVTKIDTTMAMAPYTVGPGKTDFAICWDGPYCHAAPSRGQIDGGFLNISTSHEWLVPSYTDDQYPNFLSALKTDASLVAAMGGEMLALQSDHNCNQWDMNPTAPTASIPKDPVGCLPVPPSLSMAGKVCGTKDRCTNLNEKILSQNQLAAALTTVRILPEAELKTVIADKLRAGQPFLVHLPKPSYLVATYGDRLVSVPIPKKTTPTPGNMAGPIRIVGPHDWFPTIPAKIVYSQKFFNLANNQNTKCGDPADPVHLATAKFEGCHAPYPKTLWEDLQGVDGGDGLFRDSFQRLTTTLSSSQRRRLVTAAGQTYGNDLSLLINRASSSMFPALDVKTAIYKQVLETTAVGYLHNGPTSKPPGLNLDQVKNPYVAAHKFPRTLDKAWPDHLNIYVYDKCEPFAICPKGRHTPNENITGLAIDHMKETLKMIGYSTPDMYTFKCVEDSEDLVELARKNMIDIATGCVSARADRMQVVQFAGSYFTSGLGILTVKEVVKQNMFSFFEPFTLRMWMMVMGLGSCYGLFMNLFERLHNRDQFPFVIWSLPGFVDSNLYGVSQLLQDGGEKGLTQYSGRFMKVVFQFLVMVIMTVYTGQVTATLTVGALSSSISTSSDLNGARILTPPADSYTYKYLKSQIPGSIPVPHDSTNLTELVARLKEGTESALVYNYHQLKFYANSDPDCSLLVPDQEKGFGYEEYAIMTPYDSLLASSLKEVVGFRKASNLDKGLSEPYFGDVCDMSSYFNVDPLAPVDVEGYYGLTIMFVLVACICVALWIFERKLF